MKAKMISFCETGYVQPMFENLQESLEKAQKTEATVIYFGQNDSGYKSLIMRTIKLEKIIALAAVEILKQSMSVLVREGYPVDKLREALEWFESRHSLYPKEDPKMSIVSISNERCCNGIHDNEEIRFIERFMFELIDKPAVWIVSYFFKNAKGKRPNEIAEILQMIEEEIDRQILSGS